MHVYNIEIKLVWNVSCVKQEACSRVKLLQAVVVVKLNKMIVRKVKVSEIGQNLNSYGIN
jgi:hypothetical protein